MFELLVSIAPRDGQEVKESDSDFATTRSPSVTDYSGLRGVPYIYDTHSSFTLFHADDF